MKSNATIIWQALLFATVLTLANTIITGYGDPRSFTDILFRWITVIQFALLYIVWGAFLYFRNERIKKEQGRK